MPRLPRIVIPGLPHHVTQRGNRRQRTFFEDADYSTYLDLMDRSCQAFSVHLVTYCLMPNHVHLIVVPNDEPASLARAIGSGHEAYSRYLNFKHDWRGYLWQGRFHSNVMDERYFLAAVRYVELNPVRAGLIEIPEAYPWSSVRAHLGFHSDPFLKPSLVLDTIPDWREFLTDSDEREKIRLHARTGRPLGSEEFVRSLERSTGLALLPKKPGRKRKIEPSNQVEMTIG